MKFRIQAVLFVLFTLISLGGLAQVSIQNLKIQIEGNSFWPQWTEDSFGCLKKNLNQINTNEKISIEISDVLLFQRIVEVGTPDHVFTLEKSSKIITDNPATLNEILSKWQCGNWLIYEGIR